MRFSFALLLLLLAIMPNIAFAACVANGATVVYVNGILTTLSSAKEDLNKLQKEFYERKKDRSVTFINGYNPSHLEGLGDLVQTATQMFGHTVSDVDLKTILRQIYPQVTTRKLLLVGHSQGTFYTNAMYGYLTQNGEPKEAVGVYNVATPASAVAGEGRYLTSTTDKVIQLAIGVAEEAGAPQPLVPNITIPLSSQESANKNGGHSFSGVYLTNEPNRIVADMSDALSKLKPRYAYDDGDCFGEPEASLGLRAEQVGLAAGDVAVAGLRLVGSTGASALTAIGNGVLALAQMGFHTASSLAQGTQQVLPNVQKDLTSPEQTEKNFLLMKRLYGSSLNVEDVKDLLGDTPNNDNAVALANEPTPSPALLVSTAEPPRVASTTVLIATSMPQQERVVGYSGSDPVVLALAVADTPSDSPTTTPQLFNASTTPPVLSLRQCAHSLSRDFCFVATTNATLSWGTVPGASRYDILANGSVLASVASTSANILLADNASTTLSVVAYDASSTPATSNTQQVFVFTQPVVINEISWAGSQLNGGDEWLELKNRTPYVIDLSSVAVVAVGGGAQYIQLSGDIQDFRLVQRNLGVPAPVGYALVIPFEQFADTGEQLALTLWDGASTTTVDSTPTIATCNGWCAGSTPVGLNPATLTMERISAATSGLLASNWASNDTYTASANLPGGSGRALYASLGRENSNHWPEAGWFCDQDPPIVDGATYHPRSGDCTYLSAFIPWPGNVDMGLYRGVVGSSTNVGGDGVYGHYYSPSSGQILEHNDALPPDAQPGEQFFVAMWQRHGYVDSYTPNDGYNIDLYLRTGHQAVWDQASQNFVPGTTDAPDNLMRIIRFYIRVVIARH